MTKKLFIIPLILLAIFFAQNSFAATYTGSGGAWGSCVSSMRGGSGGGGDHYRNICICPSGTTINRSESYPLAYSDKSGKTGYGVTVRCTEKSCPEGSKPSWKLVCDDNDDSGSGTGTGNNKAVCSVSPSSVSPGGQVTLTVNFSGFTPSSAAPKYRWSEIDLSSWGSWVTFAKTQSSFTKTITAPTTAGSHFVKFETNGCGVCGTAASATCNFTVAAPTPINGQCSSQYNGATLSSLSSSNSLCTTGSVSNFTTTSTGWTWKCRGQNNGSDASCSANKVVTPAEVDGECGTAARTYNSSATSWGSYSFCVSGTVSPSSPSFPTTGGSVSWTCLGQNGGDNSPTCTANRTNTSTSVDGECGTAARTFSSSSSSWGSYSLCYSGTPSPSSPSFPSRGGSTSWVCLGEGNGDSSNTCRAYRNQEVVDERIYCGSSDSEYFSSRPTSNLCSNGSRPTVYSNSDYWYWYCGDNYCEASREEEDDEDISLSCTVSDKTVKVGEEVHLRATASGGSGNYTYTWYGDSPLNNSRGRDQYVRYTSTGKKDASVTVRDSWGNTRTKSCGTITVSQSGSSSSSNLQFTCSVNSSTVGVGETVIYTSKVSGGSGSYTYEWWGSDNAYGSSPSLLYNYTYAGQKTMKLKVTSGSQSKTLDCPVVVVNNNYSGIYLNQVPYTGIGDHKAIIAFLTLLVLLSGVGSYMYIRHKSMRDRKLAIENFKMDNLSKRHNIKIDK